MALKNNSHLSLFSPAEKLTRADDLMSDVLDCFLWPSADPPKRTIKFTAGYRRPRTLNIDDFSHIIHSVQTSRLRNLTEATTLIRQLPAVVAYITNAEPPRLGKHIGLYLQLFLPRCGVKFCETNRYDQRRGNPQDSHQSHHPSSPNPSCSQHKQSISKIRAKELRDLLGSAKPTPSSSSSSSRPTCTRSNQIDLSTNGLTHLAVFATKDYSPNDVVAGCEGSFADLTEEEDLKLRSNAHLPIYSQLPLHTHRQSTDFSHIVNSRGKFQVFCGPARFVNHDCNNNVELLREGFTIKFKVIKPIKAGDEILTSYGMNYFGEKNCECMCATCEQNGSGFYSSQEKSIVEDPKVQSAGKEDDSQNKKEWEEPNISLPLSLSTDVTDLSSLADGSDETLSRASNTSTLEQSPMRSFSNTPSQVRRQLALASYHHLDALSEKNFQSHSRSSSTRRNRKFLPDLIQKNLNSTPFVSPFKFVPTHDLTLPVRSLLSKVPSKVPSRVPQCAPTNMITATNMIASFQTSIPQKPHHLIDPPKKTECTELLPIKRKTYWITTKQKQLGIVPWESDAINTPPPTSVSTPQSYSPQTPSLLNPNKRKLKVEQGMQKKTKLNEEVKEVKSDKGPKRSYWVSTKEKQLGIVPWETSKPTQSASTSTESTPTTPHQPVISTTRSTRASRKATQDTPDITRFPNAPRGSKLSYKVFQKGTPEAELLNTAIGRELLGYRPKVYKKNLPPPSQAQQQHQHQHQKEGQEQKQHHKEKPQQKEKQQQQERDQQHQKKKHQQQEKQDDHNSTQKRQEIQVGPQNPNVDTIMIPTTTATNTQNTSNRSNAPSTENQDDQLERKEGISSNENENDKNELVQNQTNHAKQKDKESENDARSRVLLTSHTSNNAENKPNDDEELPKKEEKKKLTMASGVIPKQIKDDHEKIVDTPSPTKKLNESNQCKIVTAMVKAKAEADPLDDSIIETRRGGGVFISCSSLY